MTKWVCRKVGLFFNLVISQFGDLMMMRELSSCFFLPSCLRGNHFFIQYSLFLVRYSEDVNVR